MTTTELQKAILLATFLIAPCSAQTVHPSNGVLQLTAVAVAESEHRYTSDPPEIYAPWKGLINRTIQNISKGVVSLDEMAPSGEFIFEILDAEGNAIGATDRGKRIAEGRAQSAPNLGFASDIPLVPLQQVTLKADVFSLFKLKVGHAYKVIIRRTRGFPTKDDAGKPLQQIELSCMIEIPAVGILRN